jgi:hypothetical protein
MLKNLITQAGPETSGRYCGTSRQTYLSQNCIPSLKNLHKKKIIFTPILHKLYIEMHSEITGTRTGCFFSTPTPTSHLFV